MASYPLAFPSVAVATERFALDNRQQALESPHDFALQVVHTASRWTLEWSWPRMSLPRAEGVVAWGLSLKGMVGTFRYKPDQTVVSKLTGRTLAQPGYAGNSAVQISGWGANALSTLRVGQWFAIGNQLLRITDAAALSDANGRVTVNFEPSLRGNTYSSGSPVEFVAPTGLFRLASNISPTYTLDPDRKPDFGTVQAIEVI